MVEYITYKGKKYPIRINMYVDMKLAEEGIDLGKIDPNAGKIENYKKLMAVLYYGMQAGAHFEDTPFDLERDDMVWVLDACGEDLVRIMSKRDKNLSELREEGEAEKEKKPEPSKLKQQVKQMGANDRKKAKQTTTG